AAADLAGNEQQSVRAYGWRVSVAFVEVLSSGRKYDVSAGHDRAPSMGRYQPVANDGSSVGARRQRINTPNRRSLFVESKQSSASGVPMDRFEAMQVFVRVVETGSFTKAAD